MDLPDTDLAITNTPTFLGNTVLPDLTTVVARVQYDIAVKNNGPLDAAGVTATVEFADGTSFETLTTSQGSCVHSVATGRLVVSCSLQAVPNGETATIGVSTNVDEKKLIANPLMWKFEGEPGDIATVVNPPTLPEMAASSIARVSSGTLEFIRANNVAPVLVTFPPTQIVFTIASDDCEEEEFGKFGVLLDLGCDSPLSFVDAQLGAFFAIVGAATGIAILDQIILVTVIAVFVTAESAVLA